MTNATDISEELLTAYALGELEGAERDRVIAHVATDESARRQVESIRAAADLLAWELPAENRSALLPAHRAVIEGHLYEPAPVEPAIATPSQQRRRRLFSFLGTLAASVTVVGGGFWLTIGSLRPTPDEYAKAYGGPTASRVAPPSATGPGIDSATSRPAPIHGGFAAAPLPNVGFGMYGMAAPMPGSAFVTGYPGYAGPLDLRGVTPEIGNLAFGPASRGTESFAGITENVFLPVARSPLSTFWTDVDTASYNDVRWFLAQNMPPPPDSVRIEELVNAFPYAYPAPRPDDGTPLAAHVEVAGCPWAPTHRLVRVGLKGVDPATTPLASAAEVPVVPVSQTTVKPATVATDVNVLVEFNPAVVSAYRLIGYENVVASADASEGDARGGELGAGQTVTALYEIIPVGAPDALVTPRPRADALRYQKPPTLPADVRGEMLTVKVRYREPEARISRLLEFPVTDRGASYTSASEDFKFAAAVASFGMILRASPHRGTATLAAAAELAQQGLGRDEGGSRAEFLSLVQKTRALTGDR